MTLRAKLTKHYDVGHQQSLQLFHDWSAERLTEFRAAAVLIAVTDRPDPGVMLLHRPSQMRAHPGQIAFPGGKVDAGENSQEAALREAHEELGIIPSDVTLIGPSDLYRTHSGYEITPVLGIIPPHIEIIPNPTEVAQWFEAPLDFLLDPNNHREQWVEWEGGTRPYYEIAWKDHKIWGITAALIVNLSKRLNWLK